MLVREEQKNVREAEIHTRRKKGEDIGSMYTHDEKKILQNNSACSGQHLSQSGPSDAVVVLESIVRVVGYLF